MRRSNVTLIRTPPSCPVDPTFTRQPSCSRAVFGTLDCHQLYRPDVRLQNVRAVAGEPRRAVGEVVAPHAAESLVEAQSGHRAGHPVEAGKPRLQGTGIVQPETVEFGDPEPC